MSAAVIQLIVLAAIAIFLILKLKSVLGTRDGYEAPLTPPEPAEAPKRREFEVIDGGPDHDIIDHVEGGSTAATALSAMKKVEPKFSVAEFLQGARGAYEMILIAFETGDIDKIKPYLAPEVFEAFEGAVNARKEQGIEVQAEFAGLREMVLTDADFNNATKEAEVTVRFASEVISVARNSAGEVVEGDPRTPRKQRDVWTFARAMGSSDPNWQLVATGG